MDESRKQFAEAFEELTGWELDDYPNQDYAGTCWEFWKKSRESIEIELPKRMVLVGLEDIDRTLTAINAGMANVESVVRAAGIKVKE